MIESGWRGQLIFGVKTWRGVRQEEAGYLLLPFLSWERPRPREELYHIVPNAGEAMGKCGVATLVSLDLTTLVLASLVT